MEAWPAPEIPKLPGTGMPVQAYDTAARSVRTLVPNPRAGMYVCGITPYDATHIGHAATYIGFDLLHRAWLDAGQSVTYVQNITDVDDPLLERARVSGADWRDLADFETRLFRQDMTELRVLPPDHYVGVVESMPLVIDVIDTLRSRGAAYEVDGDLYFSVQSAPGFGGVAHLDVARMLELAGERGGDPQRPGKKDPLDPVLWLAARPGEPSWESPFGPGRPGWHVECVAVAFEYLGAGFDVQGGGSDLAFPHHELGAAEAEVASGTQPYAQAYLHAGMVGLDGEKMSKSRGNLVFVSKLRRDGVDPMAIRLAILGHHYRSDWGWTAADLDAALSRLARWRHAVSRPDGPDARPMLAEVRAALAADLDAPAALAAVDRWADAQAAGGGADPGAPGLVSRTVDALLGIAL